MNREIVCPLVTVSEQVVNEVCILVVTCSLKSRDNCQYEKALEVPLLRPTTRDLKTIWFGHLFHNH